MKAIITVLLTFMLIIVLPQDVNMAERKDKVNQFSKCHNVRFNIINKMIVHQQLITTNEIEK